MKEETVTALAQAFLNAGYHLLEEGIANALYKKSNGITVCHPKISCTVIGNIMVLTNDLKDPVSRLAINRRVIIDRP